MKKAFHNLFLNSVQALEGDKLKSEKIVKIEMERPTDGIVVVRISDNGPGMDSRTLSRIFTPFFTTRAQGTGLGLAVVQKIISTMGGSIEVWSEPGQGFSSKIAFPVEPSLNNDHFPRPPTDTDTPA
jgi:signal transduction histidine kinase